MQTPSFKSSATLTLLIATALVGSACFLDYTQAIPCETPTQCPTGLSCNPETFQCEEGEVPAFPSNNENSTMDAGDFLNSTMNDVGGGNNTMVNNTMMNNGGEMGPCTRNAELVMDGVAGNFCVDRYEASRPDATGMGPGADSTMAAVQPGVVPWSNAGPTDAVAACQAAGKRLCTLEEYAAGCGGAERFQYPYSATEFVSVLCNVSGALQRTAQNPGCANSENSTFDMSANLEEIVDAGGGMFMLAGGSYLDGNGIDLKCGSLRPFAAGPQVGFRCCGAPF